MIVVDIETSGLDPEKCSILSIGALDFLRPERSFYQECHIEADVLVEEKALEINGFTIKDITDNSKVSEAQIVIEFLDWLDQSSHHIMAGLNIATFDIPFILAKAKKYDIGWYPNYRHVDLHTLCYSKYMALNKEMPLKYYQSGISADTIHLFTGIGEEPKPHNGLNGAKYEAESFARLIYGQNLLKEFKDKPVPEYLAI